MRWRRWPAAVSLAIACACADRANTSWAVALDGSGRVGPDTTFTRVVREFGRDASAGDVGVTVLFAGDPERRLAIRWRDPDHPAAPAEVRIDAIRSRWHVPPGITTGTSLEELEALNGGPFTLLGFGGGPGGTVVSWNGGALEEATAGSGRVIVRLAPALDHAASGDQFLAAYGDLALSSGHPAVRALRPRVDEVVVEFR